MKIPEIILSLFNDESQYKSQLSRNWYSTFFNNALLVEGISYDYYREPVKEMTQEKLERWYRSSVEDDNFIELYKPVGIVDNENSILEEYQKLVTNEFGGKLYESGRINDWRKEFFIVGDAGKRIENKLSGILSPRQITGVIDTVQVQEEFINLAEYSSFLDPAVSPSDVLEAWSFFLSIKNWLAIQKEVKAVAKKTGKDLDKSLSFQILKRKLDQLETRGRNALTTIEEDVDELMKAKVDLDSATFNKQKYLIENIEMISVYANLRDTDTKGIQIIEENQNSTKSLGQQTLGVDQTRILKFEKSSKNAVNKLVGSAKGRAMFKMPSAELSKLVPTIRISKVIYDENSTIVAEKEIPFPSTFLGGELTNAQDLDPYKFVGTREGYGIKSFSWEYKGADPFSVDRDISATLELYFQDFGEFTKKRDGYRYIDLLVPTEDKCSLNGSLKAGYQQDIRVRAGWETPRSFIRDLEKVKSLPSDGIQTTDDTPDIKGQLLQGAKEKISSIKASRVDIILSLADYNISFAGNGNGSATITLNYIARLESIGKNRLINVLAPTKDEVVSIEYHEAKIAQSEPPATAAPSRKQLQIIYKNIKSRASKKIISTLARNRSIYWRYVNLEEILISSFGVEKAETLYKVLKFDQFDPQHKDGLILTIDQLVGDPSTLVDDLILVKDINEVPSLGNDTKPEKITYTFLGDILQVALGIATEAGSFMGAPLDIIENFKIALLDFRVGTKPYNLANLPVEMGVFIEFLNNKVGKRDTYTKSFTSFARELIAEVLVNRVDKYLNLQDGVSRSFKLGYVDMNRDLKPNSEKSYSLENTKDLRTISSGKKEEFLVIYPDSALPSDYMIKSGQLGYLNKKKEDERNGLHHFSLGTRRNIVKNISFDKVDLEYAKERRMTMNQEDPYALLTNVFNVNLSMFGNNFFRPGSYIYVDPKVMGDLGNPYTPGTISNTMGLGGYHIVTEVTHTISSNSYETSVSAVWETSGDGKHNMTGIKAKKAEKDSKEKDSKKEDCKE